MKKFEFITITMKTKNGKTLYLKSENNKFVWTFDKRESLYFNTISEIDTFANSYFKNFKNWGYKDVCIYM